jgi:hypothetical protein
MLRGCIHQSYDLQAADVYDFFSKCAHRPYPFKTLTTVASSETSSSPSSTDSASSPQQQPQQEQEHLVLSSISPSAATRTRLASQVPELLPRGQPSQSISSTADEAKRLRLDPALSTLTLSLSNDSVDMKLETNSRPHQNGRAVEDKNGNVSTPMNMDGLETSTPSGFSRHELVRLMVQSLQSLGYR